MKDRKLNGVVQESYGYDAAGNMIIRDGDTLTYDAENRLQTIATSAGVTVTYTYDGDGRRALRDTDTETTAYAGPHYEARYTKTNKPEDLDDDCVVTVIDIMQVAAQWGTVDPLADVNDDGTVDVNDVQQVAGKWRETCHVLAGTTQYYALGGRRVAMRKGDTLYYLFADHLDSTSVSYRSDGGDTRTQRYYPWGTIRPGPANTLPTDRTFTGQQLDASTGLMYYGARYYDPALARFIQPDTIVPEPAEPQSLNRYAYVNNNPLRYSDPTGHYLFEDDPNDQFYIPSGRSPVGQPMRLADDPCLGACTGPTPLDEQTQTILELGAAILWEPADWAITINHWRRGDFSWWDLVGLAPFIPVAGVRAARHADEVISLPRALPAPRGINPWVGEIVSTVIGEETILYRVWGGDSGRVGAWLTPVRPTSQAEARRLLALPPENAAIYVSEVRVPAGTRIQIGTTAAAFGQPGGASQILLLERIPQSAFGSGEPLPLEPLRISH